MLRGRGLFFALQLISQGFFALASHNAFSAPVVVPPPPLDCSSVPSISGFVPAKPISKLPLQITDENEDGSEGWVRLGFSIDTEGKTYSISILDKFGPEKLARAARAAVARWAYEPASLNGALVAQHNMTAEFTYVFTNEPNAAVHEDVVRQYDKGRQLIAAGSLLAGIAVLEKSLNLQLNLYEHAMVSFSLAYANAKSGNSHRALIHIRHAFIENGRYLDREILGVATRLRLRLEALSGNFKAVACAPGLPPADDFDPGGKETAEINKLIAQTRFATKMSAALSVQAVISSNPFLSTRASWEHELVRFKFSFASVQAGVGNFRLVCATQVIEGQVANDSKWSVPETAGPCVLRVYGEAGASFFVSEEV